MSQENEYLRELDLLQRPTKHIVERPRKKILQLLYLTPACGSTKHVLGLHLLIPSYLKKGFGYVVMKWYTDYAS